MSSDVPSKPQEPSLVRQSVITRLRKTAKQPVTWLGLIVLAIKPIVKAGYWVIDVIGNMGTAADIIRFLNTGWGTLVLLFVGFGLIIWQLFRQEKRKLPRDVQTTGSHPLVKEACPDEWVHRVVDTQKRHLDQYVILKKIVTGDQKLSADVPGIIFGLEIRNESIFEISIEREVMGNIFFGSQLLAERIIVLHNNVNVPSRYSGTLTFEQRLSTTEAALISKSQNEGRAKFYFDSLNIAITGGTDFPQVERKRLQIPRDVEVDETSCADLKAELGPLKAKLEEYEKYNLVLEIDTRFESSLILIPNTEAYSLPGVEAPITVDEYIIKAYLKIRFRNPDIHRTTIENMALSLHTHADSGEEVVIPLSRHDLDIYPEGEIKNSLNRVTLDRGLAVGAGSITPYYWFWFHLEIPRKTVKSIGSGHVLGLTMTSMREPPQSIDFVDIDWEGARNRKTYILSQNVRLKHRDY